jgi:hypothetical protein
MIGTHYLMLKYFEKAKVQVFVNNTHKRGTRIKKNRRRTKRIIDFSISNKHDLIMSQIGKRGWNLSDHIPVLTKINLKQRVVQDPKKPLFDRKLLNHRKMIYKILEENEMIVSESNNANLALLEFNNFWQDKLRKLKVIREISAYNKTIFLPKKIKKVIKEKRSKDKQARSGILPLEEFYILKKVVKDTILTLRRNRYLKFIEKGIELHKIHDHRNSWKWIKRHCGLNRGSLTKGLVIDPINKDLVDNLKRKLEIWANHFHNLCKLDPNERILEVD